MPLHSTCYLNVKLDLISKGAEYLSFGVTNQFVSSVEKNEYVENLAKKKSKNVSLVITFTDSKGICAFS